MNADFTSLDVDALGWEKKFDLVFTSITPAISTMESLEKVIKISNAYCFNSCFVRWVDELENQIAKEVYQKEQASSRNHHGKWFYSLFNLLWIKGYFPQVRYHCQNQEEYVDANENLASYYSKCFVKEDIGKIHEYLKAHADSNGKILRKYERWYGWILWDVRMNIPRLIV
jgi:hypothetical protein